MIISDLIRSRIIDDSATFNANDNIDSYMVDSDKDLLQKEVESKIKELLNCLVIDYKNDPNTIETPKRIAKMLINEVFSGRYTSSPEFVTFPNEKKIDQLYIVGPMTVNSFCSHHFVPFSGKAWIGVIPGERLMGISKFKRLLDWIFCRPQIQENATVQLADLIESSVQPRGLAVIIKARHQCMVCRGVKQPQSYFTTSVMRGIFFDNLAARQEFLTLVKDQR